MNRLAAEFRARVDDAGRIFGHAAVFGQAARIRAGYESIAPGAFNEVLARRDDVRALINHDPSLVLGRTGAGTLKLDVDEEGLVFEVDLPDTSYARDLRTLIGRGDVTGASFGFKPGADALSTAPDGRQLRTHTNLEALYDVSVVTYPAYEGAGAALRSLFPLSAQLDEVRARRRTQIIRARHRARYGGTF